MKNKSSSLFLTIILSITLLFGFGHKAIGQIQFEQVQAIEATWRGAVAFSDVDGDGDEDAVISGRTGGGSSPSVTYLALNNEGVFTVAENSPFQQGSQGSVSFSDIDGDGDEDVLITGVDISVGSGDVFTNLYANNGGEFSLVENTPFVGAVTGDAAFSDIDGDGDEDVLIAGFNPSDQPECRLYQNNGGSFSYVENTPFEGGSNGSISFSDVDGDGDEDVLITGDGFTAGLYANDGGNFTLVEGTPFQGFESAFADIDGDGDEDVLLIGGGPPSLYTNDGGNFALVENTPFLEVSGGSHAFADMDGDGDQDVVIIGFGPFTTDVYINDGGSFTLAENTMLSGVSDSAIAFSDIDNDGDEDLLITGTFEGTGVTPPLSGTRFYENISNTTGTDDLNSKTFAIAPNPSSGMVAFDLTEINTGNLDLIVFDMKGKVVHQENRQNTNGTLMIDLAALETGVYLVSIETKNGEQFRSKLVKTD